MKFRKGLLLAVLTGLTTVSYGQLSKQVHYFDLQDVQLLDSDFQKAQQLDLAYLMALDPDRLLAPFFRESGLPAKAESYTNWENTGLDGHIAGHYLSALSLMYASTANADIKNRLDYMLNALQQCQDANGNGYIGGVPQGKQIWNEIKEGNIRAGGFSLNGKWVPLYNIHKTYAGLRDAYLYTGSQQAKEMLVKMTDWAIMLVASLSEEQIQDMLRSEHGGLNETFADVAAITQNPIYLKLAKDFSQQRLLSSLMVKEDKLTGQHANTQIPKVLGFKRIADVSNDAQWNDAARFFWDTVIEQRSVVFGGNSVSEHFNAVNDFSKMLQSVEGPETCNTYNMLRLTKMLFQTNPQSKYLDYYERALYNHILSTQNPTTGGLVYFTQVRPGHYRTYSQPQTSMWCCVGSGIENHAKYGELIYAYANDDLYVNLFIPSKLAWADKNVEITQETTFPYEGKTTFLINPAADTKFTLNIRKPKWLASAPIIYVNKEQYAATATDLGFAISRVWKKGDKVTMELPMEIQVEQMPDKSNYYSLLYGPIVLAAKTTNDDLVNLFANDSRMGHVAAGKQIPLKDLPILAAEPDQIVRQVKPLADKPLHFELESLYKGKNAVKMELEPFYKIHESRYIMYWPQTTKSGLKEWQQKIEIQEKEALKLNGRTVDKIVNGEQQPESDHFIKEQASRAGAIEDTRWREAQGWFSYTLTKRNNKNEVLYIKYLDIDKDRSTAILINDEPFHLITTNDSPSGQPKEIMLDLPKQLKDKSTFDIKFQGTNQKTSHKFLEVRVLK